MGANSGIERKKILKYLFCQLKILRNDQFHIQMHDFFVCFVSKIIALISSPSFSELPSYRRLVFFPRGSEDSVGQSMFR